MPGARETNHLQLNDMGLQTLPSAVLVMESLETLNLDGYPTLDPTLSTLHSFNSTCFQLCLSPQPSPFQLDIPQTPNRQLYAHSSPLTELQSRLIFSPNPRTARTKSPNGAHNTLSNSFRGHLHCVCWQIRVLNQQRAHVFARRCNRNNLRGLPTTFTRLQNLREISLFNNPIVALPPEIGTLSQLVELNYDRTVLRNPPSEILDRGLHVIVQFLRRLYDARYTGVIDLHGMALDNLVRQQPLCYAVVPMLRDVRY